ncbi:MAG TPA: response regulator transcription factor [Actinomycetota bacterium]|nr:response regulator transcription factor [Actinomycetota bacterium]
MTIRVVLADDHAAGRSGLRMLLTTVGEIEIAAIAQDAYEAIRLAESEGPDVVLLDLDIPGVEAATATARIREAAPQAQVLLLTSDTDDPRISEVLDGGAWGPVPKQAGPEVLIAAVRAAAERRPA